MDISNISATSGEVHLPTRIAHVGMFEGILPCPCALPPTPHGITLPLGARRELDLQISHIADENPHHAQRTPYEPKLVLHIKTRFVHFLSVGTPACLCKVVDIPGVTEPGGTGRMGLSQVQ